MKSIITLLVVAGVVYGAIYYQTGENPIDYLQERSPTKHIESAKKAADLYESATNLRIEAEFGNDN